MVTPSLVTSGEPVIRSRITLRPLGPRVLFTDPASRSTPAWSRCRASATNRSSLDMGHPAGGRAYLADARSAGRTGPPAGRGCAGPAARDRGSAGRGGQAEVEAEVLGRVLGVGEHDRPVVLVDHPAVVGRHALLEVGRGERPGLLAECLGQLVVDEVGTYEAV